MVEHVALIGDCKGGSFKIKALETVLCLRVAWCFDLAIPIFNPD